MRYWAQQYFYFLKEINKFGVQKKLTNTACSSAKHIIWRQIWVSPGLQLKITVVKKKKRITVVGEIWSVSLNIRNGILKRISLFYIASVCKTRIKE